MKLIVLSAALLALIFCLTFDVFGADIVNRIIQIRTEGGINISVSQKVKTQYESYWDMDFWEIEWDRLDVIFREVANQYGIEADPAKIKIIIREFDENWIDTEAPVNADGTIGREMMRNHFDGMYYYGTIVIHMGDDTAQGERAWCQTAFIHELGHHFGYNHGSIIDGLPMCF